MTSVLIILVTIAACFALRNPIRKAPMAFYVGAVVIDVLFIAIAVGLVSVPRPVWLAFYQLIQKCLVPLGMFIVVMYIGVFSRSSKVSLWLRPIRAELSIIACILALGHMAVYLNSYLPRLFNGSAINVNVLASFVVAVVLLVLLLLLGVTSFQTVKKRMSNDSWKSLQKLAYLFFALTYVHLLLLLGPSAAHGGIAAGVSMAVYSVIFIGYLIGRPLRAHLDKKTA